MKNFLINGHLILVGMSLHFRASKILHFLLIWSAALKNITGYTCMNVSWSRGLAVHL